MNKIIKGRNEFEIYFEFRKFILDAVKLLPGRRWMADKKCWSVPLAYESKLDEFAKKYHFTYVDDSNPHAEIQMDPLPPMPELTTTIDLKGEMFPFQKRGVAYGLEKKRLIIGDEPGLGKAQPLDALIATPNGWKRMGDIKVGDKVFGADGLSTTVTGVFPQGRRLVFKITFNDGTSTECDAEHIWCVRDANRRLRGKGWTTKTTAELIDSGLTLTTNEKRKASGRQPSLKWEIPVCGLVAYEPKPYVIDAYIFGALLGDGSIGQKGSAGICISIPDSQPEIVTEINQRLHPEMKLRANRFPACPQYYFTQTTTTKKNPYKQEIQRLQVNVKSKEKFIPEYYLQGSILQRMDLLSGLMDTDGSATKNRITYHTCSKRLASDVAELVRSLGGQAIVRTYNRKEKGMEYQVNVRTDFNPFVLPKKMAQWKVAKRNYGSKYIESIVPVSIKEQQCISVSASDHLYLTNDYIVTHNTLQSIAIITGANSFPCLVICPSSLKINWQREWEKWTNKKAVLLDEKICKNFDYWKACGYKMDVVIVNYESLKKYFVKEINSTGKKAVRLSDVTFTDFKDKFKSLIIDESHRVKSFSALQTKLTRGIAEGKEYRLALTGTPVLNKPSDLCAQLGIIGKLNEITGNVKPYPTFVNRYCQGGNGSSNLKELNYKLNLHCFYRRAKEDVLTELPSKMRQIIPCDISTRREYNDALRDLEVYLKQYREATDEQIAKSMKGEVMVRIGVCYELQCSRW